MTRAIVILGAAVWPDEQPSPTLRRRINAAAHLWHKGGFDRIIASGGLGKHPPSEAEVMRRLLRAADVPSDAILLEDRSVSTRTNAINTLELARAQQITHLTIVTDGYHGPRAWVTFKALGATPFRTYSAARSHPRPRLSLTLRQTLREVIALPVYIVRLALGR